LHHRLCYLNPKTARTPLSFFRLPHAQVCSSLRTMKRWKNPTRPPSPGGTDLSPSHLLARELFLGILTAAFNKQKRCFFFSWKATVKDPKTKSVGIFSCFHFGCRRLFPPPDPDFPGFLGRGLLPISPPDTLKVFPSLILVAAPRIEYHKTRLPPFILLPSQGTPGVHCLF